LKKLFLLFTIPLFGNEMYLNLSGGFGKSYSEISSSDSDFYKEEENIDTVKYGFGVGVIEENLRLEFGYNRYNYNYNFEGISLKFLGTLGNFYLGIGAEALSTDEVSSAGDSVTTIGNFAEIGVFGEISKSLEVGAGFSFHRYNFDIYSFKENEENTNLENDSILLNLFLNWKI
jgi:hypothetical protein